MTITNNQKQQMYYKGFEIILWEIFMYKIKGMIGVFKNLQETKNHIDNLNLIKNETQN